MRAVFRALPSLSIVAVLSLAPLVAPAFQQPTHKSLPNYDARDGVSSPAAPAGQQSAAQALTERVPGVRIESGASGTAKSVGSTTGFLTGPNGNGIGVSAAAANAFPSDDSHRPVKAFLSEHAALFGYGAEALTQTRITRDSVAPHNGMRTVVWQQEVDGIGVFNALLVGHVTTKGELVKITSEFVPNVIQAAALGTPNRADLVVAPSVSAAQAVQRAAANIGEEASPVAMLVKESAAGTEVKQKFSGGGLQGDAEVKFAWFPLRPDTLRLCWETLVTRRVGNELFRILVDVETGEVLLRHCLTAYITDATYNVFPSDSPSPFSPGHTVPSTNQPPLTNRVLLTLPAINTNASPQGWIPDGSNETRGNNVDAHTDRDGNDVADLPRPQGSPFRVFDFALDLNQSPTNGSNPQAAVVQLFYLCNWYHDKMYEFGFTEAAGNFQSNNFGRGGLGNDAVQADAQDGGGFNNANFSTPPDGSAGRMQMFLFDGPNPDIDGDLDAEIVIHEHTHGLSNRRVGNGALISALQTAGMGEGWSDFYALVLLAEPGDDLAGNYAAGAYATREFFGETENYYYGIRRYPYSTNLNKNPLTFKDIDAAQASSHAGIPRNPAPIFGGASEVHNQGEVWCSALWEVRVALVRKHGFAVGNPLTLQLVTDGMGLSVANPNFLQARDAILQADLVLTAGANQNEIWAAFAKRGMGFSASSPDSSTTTGVIEAFDIPDDLRVSPVSGLISKGPVTGPFTPAAKSYTLSNAGSNAVTWTVTVKSNWLSLSTNSGTLTPAQAITNNVTINANAVALPAGVYTNTVTFSNSVSTRAQTRTFVLAIGQPDYYTELFDAADFDLSNTSITFTPDGSTNFYGACRQPATSFRTDPTGGTAVTLADDAFTQVTLTGGSQVKLYGNSRGTFYIGSNGYLTFDTGDVEYIEALANHFNRLRIAGFFVDLDPPSSPGGSITWKQLTDRVAVTWQNIRRWGTTSVNNFQIELFFDGRIRLTYLQMQQRSALVGLSKGTGVPAGFFESDLSGMDNCPPSVTLTLPAVTIEGAGVLTNQGTVGIPVAQPTNVVVSLSSSDLTELTVPASVTILAGQTSSNFSLTVIDDLLADGAQTVFVTASAPGYLTVSNSIIVNDDEIPSLSLQLPASALESAGVLTNQGRVIVNTAQSTNTTISLFSSNVAKLTVPASVIIPAGQTSAVFNLTVINNAIVDGAVPVVVRASRTNWNSGTAVITILDDEPGSPFLDRFTISGIASPQFVSNGFPVQVTGFTALNQVDTNFNGFAFLSALRKIGTTNSTVRVHAYTGFSSFNDFDHYDGCVTAITGDFTNVLFTTTATTAPATLRTELADKHVFLVPEQSGLGVGALGLGTSWAPVLKDFVARGGIAIFTSYNEETSEILGGTGLLDAKRVNVTWPIIVTNVLSHPLTAGVSNSFEANDVAGYTSSDGTPVIRRTDDDTIVVAYREYGLGRSVMIGTDFDFYSLGSGLDRVLANAVRWAQTSIYTNVVVTPALMNGFSNGVWTGSVTGAVATSGIYLLASDGNGHIGLSNPFDLINNTPPVASNLTFTVLQNSTTNLPLAGFDPESGGLLYNISTPPTNGLLSSVIGTNYLFAYTPAHAFTGPDPFQYTVSDGVATSAAATVSISVVALPDTDGDGIPDAWEIAHGLIVGVNDAALDPDLDGQSNRQEYLANTDPHNPASALFTPTVEYLPNGTSRLTWKSIGGVRYRVQFSNGATNGSFNNVFTDVTRPAASEIDPSPLGTPSTLQFIDDYTLTGGVPPGGKRYYRIKTPR